MAYFGAGLQEDPIHEDFDAMWASFVTIHAFDRQTDRQLSRS